MQMGYVGAVEDGFERLRKSPHVIEAQHSTFCSRSWNVGRLFNSAHLWAQLHTRGNPFENRQPKGKCPRNGVLRTPAGWPWTKPQTAFPHSRDSRGMVGFRTAEQVGRLLRWSVQHSWGSSTAFCY